MNIPENEPKVVESKARYFISAVNTHLLPPDRFPVTPFMGHSSDVALKLMEGYFKKVELDTDHPEAKQEERSARDRRQLGNCAFALLYVNLKLAGNVVAQAELPDDIEKAPKVVFDTVADHVAGYVRDTSFEFDWPERTKNHGQPRGAKRRTDTTVNRPISKAEYLVEQREIEDLQAEEYKKEKSPEFTLRRPEARYDEQYRMVAAQLATSPEEEVGYCYLLNVSAGLQSYEDAEQIARTALLKRVAEARTVQNREKLSHDQRLLLLFLAGMEVGRDRDGTRSLVPSTAPVRLDGLKAYYARKDRESFGYPTSAEVDRIVLGGLKKLVRLRGE